MTRAERRKRLLVWAKTAPVHAPDFELLRNCRYVPARDDEGWHRGWAVWDRRAGRHLTPKELVRVKDAQLEFEMWRPN